MTISFQATRAALLASATAAKVALFVQPSMKKDLREVWLSPNRAAAETAIDVFAEKYGAKYPKAVECLTTDRQTLLAFYDFPAEPPN